MPLLMQHCAWLADLMAVYVFPIRMLLVN
uniref:Uncharacterized protein n=1 Tax=Arundo donax TaxID=35708 RepID=A0A0A8Z1G8_ARUDO